MAAEPVNRYLPLSITSRGIGVNLCRTLFMSNIEKKKKIFNPPSLYSLYRIYLAVFEYRVDLVRQSFPLCCHFKHLAKPIHDSSFVNICRSIRLLPEPIRMIIDAIGIIKAENKVYVPVMAANLYDSEERFMPCAESVRYSNLRKVVESLSNIDIPIEYRRNFYIHSCLPGAIWDSENFILLNPDDIMPANYKTSDLNRDWFQCTNWTLFLERKYPELITNLKRTDLNGRRSALASNSMGNLRLKDRRKDEDLESYLARPNVEWPTEEGFFYSLAKLTKDELREVSSILLGERPTYPRQNPIYHSRLESVCQYAARL